MSDSQTDPALPDLLEVEVYDQLRRIAAFYLRGERPNHTLQPTALVHEAFLRIHPQQSRNITGKTHFLALAARIMRRVLVDYARAENAEKRGAGVPRITLTEAIEVAARGREIEILDIEEALTELESTDPVLAEVVVLRFWGGMTEVEIGEHMSRSDRWVRGQWAFAKAWLRRALEDYQPPQVQQPLEGDKPLEDDKPLDG